MGHAAQLLGGVRHAENVVKGGGGRFGADGPPPPPKRDDWIEYCNARLKPSGYNGADVQNTLGVVRGRVKLGWRQHGRASNRCGAMCNPAADESVSWSVLGALDFSMDRIAKRGWLGFQEIGLQMACIAVLGATADPPATTTRQGLGWSSGNVTSQADAVAWIERALALAGQLDGARELPR